MTAKPISNLYVCWLPRPDLLDGTTPWSAEQGRAACQDCQRTIQVQLDIEEVYAGMQLDIGPFPRVCIHCAVVRVGVGPADGRLISFLGPTAAVDQLMKALRVRR